MRLRAIRAKNYRTLENIDLSFSPAYCTLSGKNNAGKSGIVRLIINLIGNPQIRPLPLPEEFTFEYKEDLIQWIKGNPPITVECILDIGRADDPALIAFVEKVTRREITPDQVELALRLTITADKTVATQLSVDGEPTDEQSAKETLTRLKGSNVLILHNSTTRQDQWYYGRGRLRAFYEVLLSGHEQDAVSQAETIFRGRSANSPENTAMN